MPLPLLSLVLTSYRGQPGVKKQRRVPPQTVAKTHRLALPDEIQQANEAAAPEGTSDEREESGTVIRLA